MEHEYVHIILFEAPAESQQKEALFDEGKGIEVTCDETHVTMAVVGFALKDVQDATVKIYSIDDKQQLLTTVDADAKVRPYLNPVWYGFMTQFPQNTFSSFMDDNLEEATT